MRSMLISLDMMVALPFASLAIMLLLSAFYGSQRYLSNSSQSSEGMIMLYYMSQSITEVISAQGMNYSLAYSFISSYSKSYGLNSSLSLLNGSSENRCGYLMACRIETIAGVAYLLRLSENNQ